MAALVFLLLLAASSAQLSCKPYKCKPPTVQFPNNTCVVTDNSEVLIAPCDEDSANSYCNVNSGKCVPPTVSSLQSYPGEPCKTQADCAVGTCGSTGVCMGLGLGAKCANSGQCGPGMFCASTGVCSQQRSVGTSCNTDYDCVSTAGCINNNCTAYFSLPVNSTVPDCGSNGLSNYCQMMTCAKQGWYGTTGKCVPARKSTVSGPTLCTSNLNCTSTDGISNYTGTCTCGYNGLGSAYCQPNFGDIQGLWLIQAYRNAVKRSNGVCNTMRRFAQACWNAIGEGENTNTQYWNFYYLPLIQGNDRCISATFTEAYWTGFALLLHVSFLAAFS